MYQNSQTIYHKTFSIFAVMKFPRSDYAYRKLLPKLNGLPYFDYDERIKNHNGAVRYNLYKNKFRPEYVESCVHCIRA